MEELQMAISDRVQSGQEELLQIARLHGENLSRRAFGERGPDLQVTLSDLEQFLRPIVAAMASGFLAASAEEQTQRLGEELPCPTCGQGCQRKSRERTLTGEQGAFSWDEAVCHCPVCDRSFFPSTDRAEG